MREYCPDIPCILIANKIDGTIYAYYIFIFFLIFENIFINIKFFFKKKKKN